MTETEARSGAPAAGAERRAVRGYAGAGVTNLLRMARTECRAALAFVAASDGASSPSGSPGSSGWTATFPATGAPEVLGASSLRALVGQTWLDPELADGGPFVRRASMAGQGGPVTLAVAGVKGGRVHGVLGVIAPGERPFGQPQLDCLERIAWRLARHLEARRELRADGLVAVAEPEGAAPGAGGVDLAPAPEPRAVEPRVVEPRAVEPSAVEPAAPEPPEPPGAPGAPEPREPARPVDGANSPPPPPPRLVPPAPPEPWAVHPSAHSAPSPPPGSVRRSSAPPAGSPPARNGSSAGRDGGDAGAMEAHRAASPATAAPATAAPVMAGPVNAASVTTGALVTEAPAAEDSGAGVREVRRSTPAAPAQPVPAPAVSGGQGAAAKVTPGGQGAPAKVTPGGQGAPAQVTPGGQTAPIPPPPIPPAHAAPARARAAPTRPSSGDQPAGWSSPDVAVGLPTVGSFFSRVGRLLGVEPPTPTELAVVVVEVCGPGGGPVAAEALRKAATALRQQLRFNDPLARVSHGSFAAVVPMSPPGARPDRVERRLAAAVVMAVNEGVEDELRDEPPRVRSAHVVVRRGDVREGDELVADLLKSLEV